MPPERVQPGTVIHTLGWPLRMEEFGGGFIYAMPNGRLSVGLVVGLDYQDPMFDPHVAFQQFKQHPLVSGLLRGGQMVRYGAKALPEGGWHTIPRPYMDGGLIAGDAGGYLNSFRLKGIHLAMRTGMLAAETAFEAVRAGDTSAARLAGYQRRIDEGPVRAELYPVRNVHQSFGYGLIPGLLYSALAWCRKDGGSARSRAILATSGCDVWLITTGTRQRRRMPSGGMKPDRVLTFDKLTNVHVSGTRHDEDQPAHLLVHTEVCHTICGRGVRAPVHALLPGERL